MSEDPGAPALPETAVDARLLASTPQVFEFLKELLKAGLEIIRGRWCLPSLARGRTIG